MRWLKVALVPLLVFAFAPAGAQPPDFPPVVDTQTLTGAGAVTYRFTVPEGADFGFELVTEWKSSVLSGDGMWLFRADGSPASAFTGTVIAGNGPQVHVEAPEPVGVLVHRPFRGSRIGSGSALALFGMEAGEYVAVIGAVSDGVFVQGSASLLGTEGVEVLSVSSSEGGFAYLDDDFRGANVSATLPIVRPIVMAGASVSATLDDGLFGWFGGIFNGISRLSVEGPGGSAQASYFFFEGEPAGTYAMTADLTLGVQDFIWAWGIDAPPITPAE